MSSKIVTGSRLLLGLMFFVFGLNGFLNFIPAPPMESETVKAFMTGLMGTGYFFPFLKGVETLCGALLLSGFYVPLALTVLAPIVINIVLFHRLMAGGPPMDLFILALMLVCAYGYRGVFRPMLQAKVSPTV